MLRHFFNATQPLKFVDRKPDVLPFHIPHKKLLEKIEYKKELPEPLVSECRNNFMNNVINLNTLFIFCTTDRFQKTSARLTKKELRGRFLTRIRFG